MSKAVRITVDDIRKAGHCVPGLQQFCDEHGLSLVELVEEGWPLSRVKDIDDANMKGVIELAKERVNGR